eukprot:41787-Amphidinium_carterae.1
MADDSILLEILSCENFDFLNEEELRSLKEALLEVHVTDVFIDKTAVAKVDLAMYNMLTEIVNSNCTTYIEEDDTTFTLFDSASGIHMTILCNEGIVPESDLNTLLTHYSIDSYNHVKGRYESTTLVEIRISKYV